MMACAKRLLPLGYPWQVISVRRRSNVLHKPFDNPKVRAALFEAFNQTDFLQAAIGDPRYYKVCKAMFICDSPLGSGEGMENKLESNVTQAKAMLKAAGYDGTPVVLLHSTDLQVLTNLAPVAKSLLEKAGFRVEIPSSDWQTVVARRMKKDLPSAGGWNGTLASLGSADLLNPVVTSLANAACDKANFGWPCKAAQIRSSGLLSSRSVLSCDDYEDLLWKLASERLDEKIME